MTHPPASEWQVLHIHPAAPAKPAVGAPCNGCGVCCLSAPCPLGMLLSRRRTGACAALRWDGQRSRYLCGAISQSENVLGPRWRWMAPLLGRWARRWIAAGVGCDSSLQVEPGQR
nr:hypothetical protein [uncultured Albidiferax sp.]